jgi:hypothetical protein
MKDASSRCDTSRSAAFDVAFPVAEIFASARGPRRRALIAG